MFKTAGCLCFGIMSLTLIILLIVILATSCIEHKAIMLLNELDMTNKYLEEFYNKRLIDTYDALKVFNVKTQKDLDEELKRLNGIIDGLKKKSSKCVEEQKSGISNLSDIGRLYSVCSSILVDYTQVRSIKLYHDLPKYFIYRTKIYEKCANEESCIELVKTLEGYLEDLHFKKHKYTRNVNHLINKKIRKLEDCSTVLELKIAGEDVIEKINVCAGLNS